MIGSRGLDRPRLHERVVHRVGGARRARRPARRRAGGAGAPTDSSSRSSRSPKPDPKSIPKASCSRSNHAPPMPRIARPPLRWSSVTASFAVRPGLRNVFAPTIRPERRAARHLRPAGEHRPALEDRALPRPDDRVEVVPRPEARGARLLGADGGVAQRRPVGGLRPQEEPDLDRRARSAARQSSSRWSWTPVIRTRNVTRGWRRNSAIDDSVGPLGVVAVGERDDVLARPLHVRHDLLDLARRARSSDSGPRGRGRRSRPRPSRSRFVAPAAAGARVEEDPAVVVEPVPDRGLARRAVVVERGDRWR